MSFTESQRRTLDGKLDGRNVKTREFAGRSLSYLEAWHAIAEANRIFGFDGWDRETMHIQCVTDDRRAGSARCAYLAKVRVKVRAGETFVVREATGMGSGEGPIAEAHESAAKEAETDAMKRALATFGNLFGLALYDKEQRGVRRPRNLRGDGKPFPWRLFDGAGAELDNGSDARMLCAGLRKLLSEATSVDALTAIWSRNEHAVGELKRHQPDLTNARGTHYAEMLESIYARRQEELTADHRPSNGVPSLANHLAERTTRKRDLRHLQFVATRPCLVCGRTPSQAHHLKTAQPRALGRKSGDEWTVPLCAIHHRALHDDGDETRWWAAQGIDPFPEARRLWETTRTAPSIQSGGNGALSPTQPTLPINLGPLETSEL
jgi:DNA recombination protein Rad52